MAIDKEKIDSIFKQLDKDAVVGILLHPSPDPDCMGAAVGFATLLKEVFELESTIYHLGEVSHPMNKSLKNILHIPLQDGSDFTQDDADAIVVLDTDLLSTGFGERVNSIDVRIDHHSTDRDEGQEFSDVRLIGSTCSIVWDYLNEYGVDLTPYSNVATAMILGIKSDTLDFSSSSSAELDMEAYRALLPYVDKTALARVTKFPLPKEVFELESLAYANKKERGTTLVSFIGELSPHSRDSISTIADRFARMAGISTVVIMALIDDHLQASIRSDDARVDVNDLCVKAFGKKYSGAKSGAGGARLPLTASFQHIHSKDVKDQMVAEIMITFQNKIFEVLGEEQKE